MVPTTITTTTTCAFYSTNRPLLKETAKIDMESIVAIFTPSTRATLKQQDLTIEEEQLKKLLQQLDTTTQQQDVLLERIRDALEQLAFWEDSLYLEEYLQQHLPQEQAQSIFRQGKLYMRMGTEEQDERMIYQASLKYQQALELFGSLPDRGNVLVAMAGIPFERGNLDECLDLLKDAEPFLTNDTDGLVKCWDNQGMIYRMKGEYEMAMQYYQKALTVLLEKESDFTEESSTTSDDDPLLPPAMIVNADNRRAERKLTLQMHIADMFSAMDQMDEALECYHALLEENKKRTTTETALDGVVLHNIGVIHSQQGKLELALKELNQALENKKRFGGETNLEVANTLNALGSIYGVLDQKRNALNCFQEALVIVRMHSEEEEEANDPLIFHLLRNIAILKGDSIPKKDMS